MSRPRMLQALLAALLLAALPALAEKPPAVGTFKDWNNLDQVEIAELFKLGDFAKVTVQPLATDGLKLPDKDDNTYPPMVAAVAAFNARFLAKLQKELEPMTVEAAADKPAPATPAEPPAAAAEPAPAPATAAKVLLVRGEVTKMNPGSQAARYWAGFGAGHARVEIRCEVVDAPSGKVLAKLLHARTSSGGLFGGSYERLLRGLTEEVAQDLAKLVKAFR